MGGRPRSEQKSRAKRVVFEHPACGERESRFSSAGKRSQERIPHASFATQNLHVEESRKSRNFTEVKYSRFLAG
jgi:hypothetical protein